MPSNAEAAEIFRNIADLLDVLGERFKPEAYRRAARSIDTLTEDLAQIAARDELDTIPGVGEAIGEKIREYLGTGHIAYYDRLQKDVPPGVVEIMRLPGLGPKTARRFWTELGVGGPPELSDAIAAGRLDSLKGFGPRKIELIREALATAKAVPGGGARLPIDEAYPTAMRILKALRERSRHDRVEIAGSFRRRRETVGDLDILVTSDEPERVFDTFSSLSDIREVQQRGTTKETVFLKSGLQVDLRVVDPRSFGAAMVYFTGSKDHNVRLRTIARDRGLKVNEYGVTRGEEIVGGRTEEDVYAALRLAWIPPELREDRGEIEAAAQGPLPPLVEEADVVGDLHVHLSSEGGASEVDRFVAEARRRKYRYLGLIIARSTAGSPPWIADDRVLSHLASIHPTGLELLRGVEIAPGASLPTLRNVSPEYVVLPARDAGTGPGPTASGGPPIRLIAHFSTGPDRTVGIHPWIERAKSTGAAVEVGPGMDRLDSNAARMALEAGVRLAIATGLGADPEDPTLPIALGFARRAGAGVSGVANAGAAEGGGARRSRPGR